MKASKFGRVKVIGFMIFLSITSEPFISDKNFSTQPEKMTPMPVKSPNGRSRWISYSFSSVGALIEIHVEFSEIFNSLYGSIGRFAITSFPKSCNAIQYGKFSLLSTMKIPIT